MNPDTPWDYRLPAILLVAVVLRLFLVGCGGQFYFGDEGRYERGSGLYLAMATLAFTISMVYGDS